ncbi:hypothetical protein CIK05_00035 [Bdellovibrio sp. qaytius]|nr:hypothetical protein CIK05_00035 [Bdellovibrio sp. qaytius]
MSEPTFTPPPQKPKKNKYLMFGAVGFELTSLILLAIYGGEYVVKQGYPNYLKALFIVLAFVVWFISLITKLRSIDKD